MNDGHQRDEAAPLLATRRPSSRSPPPGHELFAANHPAGQSSRTRARAGSAAAGSSTDARTPPQVGPATPQDTGEPHSGAMAPLRASGVSPRPPGKAAMSPLKQSNNLAARMGRWSASHWKTAVFGWLAFVAAALVIGQMVGTKQLDMNDTHTGQARQADQLLRQAGLQSDPQTEIVLIQNTRDTVRDAAFRAVVADVARAVQPFRTIEHL